MSSLEAKIVVLGAQGVGKTSLVMRYCHGSFNPSQVVSTVGASFMTKRVVDTDTDTVVRLQIWDTAGQERFRSISRLYYRGANACILCYSITDAKSFTEMGVWLTELRRNLPPDIVLHVVGTKADIVAKDPSRRQVPFERCIAYVAENLAPGIGGTPPPTASTPLLPGIPGLQHHAHEASTGGRTWSVTTPLAGVGGGANSLLGQHVAGAAAAAAAGAGGEPRSPSSKRSSGFWGQEAGWDACHEISAESGEGVEEVFRVVTRKLVEQNRRMQQALLAATAAPGVGPGGGVDGVGGGGGVPWAADGSGLGLVYGGMAGGGAAGAGSQAGYFDVNPSGSFRVGRDRRSWLGFSPAVTIDQGGVAGGEPGGADQRGKFRRRCC